jgi:hypothetical protein
LFMWEHRFELASHVLGSWWCCPATTAPRKGSPLHRSSA